MKKILIVGAHPDDEILGCGGSIIKHIQNGDEVSICIVTTTFGKKWNNVYKKNKLIEAKNVDTFLNIKKRYYCNFPTTKLNTISTSEMNDKLYDIINKVNPDIIYTHFGDDVNEDHRVIFNSLLVCTRPINNKIALRCFETLSSTEWGIKCFSPNFYVCLDQETIRKKIKAFSFYESEVKKYPHPRSKEGIINLAKKRGNEICTEYAESFITIKDYWV
jgi:LmbE family N-acetylglucosaminyl deacetylase